MIHQKIKNLFMSSVEHVCSNISNYSIHPDIEKEPSSKLLFGCEQSLCCCIFTL